MPDLRSDPASYPEVPALVAALSDRTAPQIRSGAFESLEHGRDDTCEVSHACHWAVNMASSADRTYMWGHAYTLEFLSFTCRRNHRYGLSTTCVASRSGVGYHSGSHFSI